MPIDYSKLRSVTARRIVQALVQDGFELDRQRGTHQQYRHPKDRRRVTVSFHKKGDTFKIKTLKTIIEKQAEWEEEDLRRLKLLK